jgi:hypothetical protein
MYYHSGVMAASTPSPCYHHIRLSTTLIKMVVQYKLAVIAAVILTIFSSAPAPTQAHPFLPSDIGSTINTFYKENPFKSAFLTCSIKGCSADMAAQFISSQRKHREEEDRRLTTRGQSISCFGIEGK